jgi:outer membrane usher protein
MALFRHPTNRVLTSFLILFLIFSPRLSRAAEQIIVSITQNTEKKGDFLVLRSADGDYFLRKSDLAGFGISLPPEKELSIDGEKYYSLRSLSGISYVFNENKLSLDLRVAPELLPTNVIDLFPPRRKDIYYPHDFGAFFNYGIDYNHSSPGADNTTVTQQIGLQKNSVLLLSDSIYTDNSTTRKLVRLMSSLNLDDRNALTRLVVGDSLNSSGDLGSTVNLGGVSFSKVFRMNPYLITYPTVHFAGVATLPSDAELYINGMKMRTEKLAPGGFDFRNITSYLGAGTMEIVLRDPFGREQRISNPFYFSNQLLHEGLHEYNYSTGFERKNFGVEGNSYGRFAFSGFDRYGLTETLTIGGNIEGTSDAVALSGQGSRLFPKVGMVTAAGGASLGGDGKNGVAGSVAYSYQAVEFNTRLAVRGFSPGYTTVAGSTGSARIRYDTSASVGYGTRGLGTVSLSGTYVAQEDGAQRLFTVAYARNLTSTTTLATNFTFGGHNTYESNFFAGITWNPAPNTVVSARVDNGSQSRDEVVEIQKNAPIGEGFGYHALASHSASSTDTITTDAAIQYNGRYGRYVGEFTGSDSGSGTSKNFRFNVAGSALLLGDRIGFSRPVSDSFALVKVGNLEGVKVYQFAQEMGTTNSHGELFVPDLGSFNDNPVSIKASNIPINYALKTIELTVSPPFRSGACVIFPVKKLQPVSGTLKAKVGGSIKPLEFAEMTVDTDKGQVVIPTGLGGEFYWEEGAGKSSPANVQSGCSAISESLASAIKPGRYRGTAVHENRTFRYEFDIPQSESLMIDVGEIIAELSSENGQEKPKLEREGEKSSVTPEAPAEIQGPAQPAVPGKQ